MNIALLWLWLLLLAPLAPIPGDEKDGWELMRKREYAAALNRFEKDAKKHREWAELQDAMGWCHFFLDDYEAAEACFREALENKPGYRWSLEGLEAVEATRRAPLELADALLEAGRYPEARAAYQRIHEGLTAAAPEARIAALVGEGWCLYSTGRFREAIVCFRSARKQDRENAEALRGMAYCDYAQGDHRRALTSLRLALEIEPGHYATRLTGGWALYFLQDFEEALGEFELAEDTVPGAWGAWSGIGWCRVRLGDDEAALEAFRRGLEISPYVMTADLSARIESDPEWRVLHNVAGWSALRANLASWALSEFQSAEALGSDVPQALGGQAFALFRMERYAEAADRAEAALEAGEGGATHRFPVTPTDGPTAEVAMNLSSLQGWIAYRQGRYDDALERFRDVRKRHVAWVDPACGEGWVLYAQGNYPAAERAFDEALQLLPGYSDARAGATAIRSWRYADYDRGWTGLLGGDVEIARRAFERILEDSRNPFPRARLDLVEASLGWVEFRGGDAQQAEKHFASALRMDPDLGLALQGWGYMELARERWALAARHLTAACGDPELAGDAELRAALGRCLLEQGKMEEAGAAFQEAVELDSTYASAHAVQAVYYLRNGEPVAARVALERAFSLDPTLSTDPVIAPELERVAELVKLHATLGWAWFYRGEYGLAESSFREATEEDPLEPTAGSGLGLSLLRQGELAKGRKVLEAWLKDAPQREDPWGIWSSTLSELAWTLFYAESYRDALVAFRELEALHKGQKQRYADPFDGQGWCLLRLGSELAAKAKFEEALEITMGYPSSLAGLEELGGEEDGE